MKILVLMENTSNGICACQHGFSIYVETNKHRLIIDTGASSLTWENAKLMGIDIAKVDTLILSHGHYDHSGGILSFYEKNKHAKIYVHQKAGGEYYSIRERGYTYIGINKRILELPTIEFINNDTVLDDEIHIFTHVKDRKKWPTSNLRIREYINGEYLQDTFEHEQYVVIHQNGKSILISGCAHNGIINILSQYRCLYGNNPDIVISGFHMKQKKPFSKEEVSLIQSIGEELKEMHTTFYTGHCTGEEAFLLLKEIMGDQCIAIHSGDVLLCENI